MKRELTVKQYISGTVTQKTDFVVREDQVRLLIDGVEQLAVSISPEDYRPFAYGFLLTSGLIESPEDVLTCDVSGNDIHIRLKNVPDDFRLVLSSGCGSGAVADREIERKAFDALRLPDLDTLPDLFAEFNRQSEIFKQTGGLHSSALSDGNEVKYFSEDVGRHNAVDKVIGKAMLAGDDPGAHFLLTSGRISGEIVKKAFYGGLRAIVSRSAPTCAAVKRASMVNIGIIGFLRGKRFNIYDTLPGHETP